MNPVIVNRKNNGYQVVAFKKMNRGRTVPTGVMKVKGSKKI